MKTLLSLVLALALLAPATARPEASEFQPRVIGAVPDYDAGKKAIKDKDWAGAIVAFDRVARNDPNDADAQNFLGYAHRKQSNLELAFKHYARALELNPRHLGAHEYVGEAYLMVGKLDKAKEHLATLDRICPAACEERDDLRKAIGQYERTSR